MTCFRTKLCKIVDSLQKSGCCWCIFALRYITLVCHLHFGTVKKIYISPPRAPPNVIKISMACETGNEARHDYAQRYSAVLLLVDVDP